ncbi:MAG: single-stranded DNA-binding protein [Candidatus Caenarcaniphilales bacterium]|nr:single-stranded DNA-binding protein [Candidatus Caenarcaniphilales bacterium]
MSLNKATLVGKILAEPESRFTNSDEPVVRLYVLTGTNTKLRVVCYKALAEKAGTLKVGDMILASGTLIAPSFKTQAGVTKKDFEINARDLYKISGSINSLNPISVSVQNFAKPSSSKPTQSSEEDLSEVLLEEEIPF